MLNRSVALALTACSLPMMTELDAQANSRSAHGFSAGASNIAAWTAHNASVQVVGPACRIRPASQTPSYARLDSPEITLNVDTSPFVTIWLNHDPQQDFGWSLLVNNDVLLPLQSYTRATGVVTFDLRDATGFRGTQRFFLSLYTVGKAKSIDVHWLRIATTPIMPSYALTGRHSENGYALYSTLPFTAKLNSDLPESNEIDKPLSIVASPGEYEPASLSIYAARDLANVAVAAGDLTDGRGHTIPRERIDIRTVKVWYQGGDEQEFGEPVLVPELLLKNDDLIHADTAGGRNILNFSETFACGFSQTPVRLPIDGPDLNPVNIPANTSKEFWLTVEVPEGTSPGLYESTVTVTPANGPADEAVLRVRVLPLALREPEKLLSIYYYGPSGFFYSQTPDGALRELMDMRAHGLNSAGLFGYYIHTRAEKNTTGRWEMDLGPLRDALELRVKAGLTGPTLFALDNYGCRDVAFRSFWSGNDSETAIAKVTDIVGAIEAMVRTNGYPEIYYYGIDEPAGENLPKCARIFEAIRKAGGKTTTAVYNDELAAELSPFLDMPIYGIMQEKLYREPVMVKQFPLQLNYWHPLENPNVDRLRYGLFLWKSGLDGSCSYAYRHVYQDDPYHDEATGQSVPFSYQRNSMYTYPSQTGPIPTIQWEAVREGIDDLRYLTTLAHIVKRAGDTGTSRPLQAALRTAHHLLEHLPPAFHGRLADINETLKPADYRAYRLRVARQTIRLQRLLDDPVAGGHRQTRAVEAELTTELKATERAAATDTPNRMARYRHQVVPSRALQGSNLVRNPDFEIINSEGQPAAWELVKDPDHSRADTLQMDAKTFNALPVSGNGNAAAVRVVTNHARSSGLCQKAIHVEGDATYTFSMKHVEKATGARNLFVAVTERDAKGNEVTGADRMAFRGESYLAINVPQSSIWTVWRRSFSTRPDTTTVDITIYPNGTGRAWFDDIALVAEPPPQKP